MFTRSGATWTQQGPKLTGSGETGDGAFGYSVALSADGNTALIGGPCDNSNVGAAWVFTRSGGPGRSRAQADRQRRDRRRRFGSSVALSADGNTALIGGPATTATWGRRGCSPARAATWTQQGAKLTGSGETGAGQFGSSVALSADGDTALIGGPSTTAAGGRRGCSPARARPGRSRAPKLTGSGETGTGGSAQRGAVGRREHRPDRRLRRQRRRGGGVGVHPLGRDLDAAGREADRQRRDRHRRASAASVALSADGEHRPDRRPATTAATWARRGCSRARAAPGRSRARS